MNVKISVRIIIYVQFLKMFVPKDYTLERQMIRW